LNQPGQGDGDSLRVLRQLYDNEILSIPQLEYFFKTGSRQIPTISKFLCNIHELIGKASKYSDPIDCVVIGAGTNGLLSAIQLFKAGCHPIVFEKRTAYTRNIWLDLYPEPWSSSFSILSKLGLEMFEHISQTIGNSDSKVITVRIQILEMFLSKICRIVGIDLIYGSQMISGNIDERSIVIRHINGTTTTLYPHILVGSDGTKSVVRGFANISLRHEISFPDIKNRMIRRIPNLSQLSLIVNFVANASNHCPDLKSRPDPWHFGFSDYRVHSVFKRWYMGYCQLQILFHHDMGQEIRSNFQHDYISLFSHRFQMDLFDSRYPIGILYSIVEYLFVEPPQSLLDLARMIKSMNPSDLHLLNTRIMRSETSTKVLSKEMVVFLSGDASITPHFRLGIGVNNGFIAFTEMYIYQVARKLNEVGRSTINLKTFDFSKKIQNEVKRLDKMVEFQTSTIFYEAYCKKVIFFDGFKQLIYDRDHAIQDYYFVKHPKCKFIL
jgi:hypothetical protein